MFEFWNNYQVYSFKTTPKIYFKQKTAFKSYLSAGEIRLIEMIKI